jgi:hypothetical protein
VLYNCAERARQRRGARPHACLRAAQLTPREYLETALRPVPGSGRAVEAKNAVRASSAFACTCVRRPVVQGARGARGGDGRIMGRRPPARSCVHPLLLPRARGAPWLLASRGCSGNTRSPPAPTQPDMCGLAQRAASARARASPTLPSL